MDEPEYSPAVRLFRCEPSSGHGVVGEDEIVNEPVGEHRRARSRSEVRTVREHGGVSLAGLNDSLVV
jgi:hypothetical protein